MNFRTLTSADGIGSNHRIVDVFLSIVPTALLAAAFSCAIGNCFSAACLGMLLTTSVITSVVMSAMGVLLASRQPSRTVAIIVASATLVCMLMLPPARAGFYAFINVIIAHLNSIFGLYLPLVVGAGLLCESMTFSLLGGLFAGSCSWLFVSLSVSWPTLLIVVVCGVESMVLQLGDSAVAMALGVAGWLVQCRAYELRGSTVRLSQVVVGLGGLCAACGVLFLLTTMFVQPMPALSAMSSTAVSAIDKFRFGSDTLPEGDLSQASDMNEGTATTLSLTTDRALGDDLLLKGFVGSTFDGTSWHRGDWVSYEGEWSGVREWMRKNGLTVAEQRAAFDTTAEREGKDAVETAKISVNASGANRRYAYAPYTLRSLSGVDAMLTGSTITCSGLMPSKTYAVIVDNVPAASAITDSTWLASSESAYAKSERVYASFVREHYLGIDDDERGAVEEYLFASDSWDANANVSEAAVVSRVRTMLSALASDTDNPPTYAEAGTFTKWFLGTAHEGNSAYFATVATLAFRSQGIPARYVEGYRASDERIARAYHSGSTLYLTAADAHAWTEVYLDGQGWTPVEVTPGYYSQPLDADKIVDVGEAWSNGTNDSTLDVGAVAGKAQKKRDKATVNERKASVVVKAGAAALVFVALVSLALLGRMLVVRHRRARDLSNDDQDICIPALYSYLVLVMEQSGVAAFDETKPLECLDAFAEAFPAIDPWEYRRVIQLYQAYVFGGYVLKPNELRTLRRFAERLHQNMPAPKNFIERFRRCVLHAL